MNNTLYNFPKWPTYAENTGIGAPPGPGGLAWGIWNAQGDGVDATTNGAKFGIKSNQLSYVLAGASGSLICSLLNVVLTYFFLAVNKFSDAVDSAPDDQILFGEETDYSKEVRETDWTVWWQMVKWLILGQFVATAVGVVLAFLSLCFLMDIKVRPFISALAPSPSPTLTPTLAS